MDVILKCLIITSLIFGTISAYRKDTEWTLVFCTIALVCAEILM